MAGRETHFKDGSLDHRRYETESRRPVVGPDSTADLKDDRTERFT